jgi:hypothetical protein
MKKEIIANTIVSISVITLSFLLGYTLCKIDTVERTKEVLHNHNNNPSDLLYIATGAR